MGWEEKCIQSVVFFYFPESLCQETCLPLLLIILNLHTIFQYYFPIIKPAKLHSVNLSIFQLYFQNMLYPHVSKLIEKILLTRIFHCFSYSKIKCKNRNITCYDTPIQNICLPIPWECVEMNLRCYLLLTWVCRVMWKTSFAWFYKRLLV